MLVAMLGNCMVDRVCREAMRALMGERPAPPPSALAGGGPSPASGPAPAPAPAPSAVAEVFVSMLRSPLPVLVVKTCAMLGNMCGDVALRQVGGWEWLEVGMG